MDKTRDLGPEAVERLKQLWQVDPDRIEPTEQGFDWWPSRFRVSVLFSGAEPDTEAEGCRLVVRTEFLKGVRLEDARTRSLIAQLASFSPSYGWSYPPPEVMEEYEMPKDGRISFQSTAYIRHDNIGWLPEFIGRMAVLQPIDAHVQADSMAELLHGQPDVSAPGGGSPDDFVDDILGVAADLYAPKGQEESQWQGSEEFAEIAEQFGRSDLCYGNGDSNGLTLETPIGSSSALIRLKPDVQHPRLGSGLMVSIQLPFQKDENALVDESAWFDFFESVSWTNTPRLGSWHPRELPNGSYSAAQAIFVPNALYQDGLATNLTLWQVGRARWMKQRFWGHLEDLTMAEVLKRRFDAIADN